MRSEKRPKFVGEEHEYAGSTGIYPPPMFKFAGRCRNFAVARMVSDLARSSLALGRLRPGTRGLVPVGLRAWPGNVGAWR
jgi:hypothetical protein